MAYSFDLFIKKFVTLLFPFVKDRIETLAKRIFKVPSALFSGIEYSGLGNFSCLLLQKVKT